jgi:release factor glutamine methyltransferase
MAMNEILRAATMQLEALSETPELDARLLLQHALGVTHEYLIAHGNEPICSEASQCFDALLARRKNYEPLAYIFGEKDFWRDRFFVTPDTLIPRPDSETMIEGLLKYIAEKNTPLRILDLGTGSGCLALSALREYPNATAVALDISSAALEVTKKNAQALGMQTRIDIRQSHWCRSLTSEEIFDVVLCNPPYVSNEEMQTLSPNVLQYEPHGALTDFDDGLKNYRELFECLPNHITQASLVLFEVGCAQANDVSDLAEKNNFQTLSIEHDIAGIPRVVCVRHSN